MAVIQSEASAKSWPRALDLEAEVLRHPRIPNSLLRRLLEFQPALLALACVVAWLNDGDAFRPAGPFGDLQLVRNFADEVTGLYYWLGTIAGHRVRAGIRESGDATVVFYLEAEDAEFDRPSQPLALVQFLTSGDAGRFRIIDTFEGGRPNQFRNQSQTIGPKGDVPNVDAAAMAIAEAVTALLAELGLEPMQLAAS